MSFQSITLTVAIIGLIVILIFIGVMLSRSSTSSAKWPPVVGDCPDYWEDLGTDGSQCLNSKSLGKCNVPSAAGPDAKDFTVANFTGDNPSCAKYKWAKTCEVTWDGITYGIPNPCDTTTTTTPSV